MLDEILNKKDSLYKLVSEIKRLQNAIRHNKDRIHKNNEIIRDNQTSGGLQFLGGLIITAGLFYIIIVVILLLTGGWNGAIFVTIFIPIIIMAFFIWLMTMGNDDVRRARQYINKYVKDNENIEVQLNHLNEIDIPNVHQEIKKLEENYHNKLVEHFISNYDKDNNGEIDVLENKDDYLKYLKSYQEKIIEISERMGEDYIHVLVKINDKLNLKREGINKSLVEIMKIKNKFDEFSNIEVYDTFIKNELQYYNSLLANALYMSSSLVNNDRITFRTIYERFDKLNVFNTHYENQTLNLLNSINNNLKEIIREINNLNLSVTSAIEDLTYATQEQTDKITQELKSLDSSINFNTLVTGINAYQNYKTNKKLNP